MNELFLLYLWENKLLKPQLQTIDGDTIEVLHTGYRNTDSGPDFSQARVRIGDTLWAGNVEMHVNASDWYKHRHDADKNYDSVVLHVVFHADKQAYTTSGNAIPTLELKGCFDEDILLRYRRFIDSRRWIACEQQAAEIQRFTWLSWLDRIIVERLELKTEEILFMLEQAGNDWDAVFYRRLMSNFGFKVNNDAFDQLARLLPYQLLLKHADQLFQLEALLYGTAGMLEGSFLDAYPLQLKKEYAFLRQKYQLKIMEPSRWKFMRMRPTNFPTIRIAQLAALFHKNGRIFSEITEKEDIQQLSAMFAFSASEYWNNHYRFDVAADGRPKNTGQSAIHLVLINTVAQMLFAYGMYHGRQELKDRALMLLESIEAEDNEIIRKFRQAGISASNALQSQALIHLKQQYCNPRRCLECRIGNVLIKSPQPG